jgi:hypothetical protein
MVVRSSWEVHLRLSLLTCPVALSPCERFAETRTTTSKKPGACRRAA